MRHPLGYARLNISVFMSAVLVLSVLIYQSYEHRQLLKGTSGTTTVANGPTQIQVFPQTLPPLGKGLYEVAVQDQSGQAYSLGSFTVGADQKQILDASGHVIANGLFALPPSVGTLTRGILYIRPDLTSNDRVAFLDGPFSGDRAHMQFSMDATRLQGRYMLATPTDGDAQINELSGVWFGDVDQGQNTVTLPALPTGWVYEGWAIVDGHPLTTGRFSSASRADLSAPFSGSVAGPNFPGEDFLRNPPTSVFPGLTFPLDMRSQAVMISVEPDIRGIDPTGASPFGIHVLESQVSKRAEPRESYALNPLTNFPKASIVAR